MVKLSIVIPNYNKEQWLEPLLSHLKEQMTDEVEVIIIDDASTDNSMKVISKYKNDFIILSNSENMYNSYTRNVGLDKAIGEYVTFIDSDDDIVPNFIHTILENIKTNHDGYFFDYHLVNVHNSGIVEKGFNTMVWSKVFKREIIDNNNIRFDVERFPRGLLGEDYDFVKQFLHITQDIIKLSDEIILYNWGIPHSVSNSPQYGVFFPRVYEDLTDEQIIKWFT